MLLCNNLSKSYNGSIAIDRLTCEIKSSALGLLGPNGSGKTTLIKLMIGLIYPTKGSVELNSSFEDIRVIPDQPKLPEELTVEKWIETVERMHGENNHGVDIQSFFQLQGNWKIKNLSSGQRRKAALIPLFYGTPDLIILDEPTNFLDIVSRERTLRLLRENINLNKSKLILATHRLSEMRIFAREVMILKEGKLIKTITINTDLPKSYSIRVNNNELLEKHLTDRGLDFHQEKNNMGKFYKVRPTNEIWDAIDAFVVNGGIIYNFSTNDELNQTLEGLLR